MIEFNAMLNGIIECFSQAVKESDGTNTNMLEKFDILRFRRLAMLDPLDEYRPHLSLLNKLHYSNNWNHTLRHEILRELPRGAQKGIVYLTHGNVLSDWINLDYVSAIIQIPHDSYLFIRLTFCPKQLCIDKLYACKVTKVNDYTFQNYDVEGSIPDILDLLYSFSSY